jgi:4-amino-4-deoxy-L-arabinose transferase-like glycosyltransferase
MPDCASQSALASADAKPCSHLSVGNAAAGVLVFTATAVLFFFHLGAYGLWEPDEARYAEIAREMLASGNFIVPHLNYVPYIEKPPLLYWLTALSMKLWGVNEFGARFPTAAAALIGVLATYIFVRRAFDSRRAIMAAAILATSALYAVMAQVLTTDMLLTAIMTVATSAFFLQWREGGRWWWVFYVAMGLAVLTKGPVGAVIPIGVGVIFLWYEGELSGSFRRFHTVSGLLATAALTLPWFIAVTIREPGFFQFYIVGEHFRRFLQPGYSHHEAFYYYLPVIAGGFLPWSLIALFVPWRSLEPSSARRFCLIVTATILVLFSVASAKLVPYVLPAFPFMAALVADGLATFFSTSSAQPRQVADSRRLSLIGPPLLAAGLLVVIIALSANHLSSPYLALARPALYVSGVILIVAAVSLFACFREQRFELGMGLLFAFTTATLVTISYGRILTEPTRSYALLARQIERVAPNARLICYPRYIQSLPFYCRRRVILVGAPTELAYGAAHAVGSAQYFFSGRDELLRLWREPQFTVLIIDRGALAPIEDSLAPYDVIASDSKKLALIHAVEGRGDRVAAD